MCIGRDWNECCIIYGSLTMVVPYSRQMTTSGFPCHLYSVYRPIQNASAGNRTRIDCLEGNHANRYTTDASDVVGVIFMIKFNLKVNSREINLRSSSEVEVKNKFTSKISVFNGPLCKRKRTKRLKIKFNCMHLIIS